MATLSNRVANNKDGGRVLVVAALGRELAAFGPEDSGLTLLETGEGVANAERALRVSLETQTPRAVIGIGFGGGLSPSLRACDLLIARQCRAAGSETVSATGSMLEAARRSQKDGDTERFGATVTVDYVVHLAEEKRELASTLAPGEMACVDMESLAFSRVCTEREIPFLVTRAVTDLFAEDLPVDFNKCRRSDGRISNWKVAASALRRRSSFKSLWELRQRSKVCSDKLAAFVRRLVAEID